MTLNPREEDIRLATLGQAVKISEGPLGVIDLATEMARFVTGASPHDEVVAEMSRALAKQGEEVESLTALNNRQAETIRQVVNEREEVQRRLDAANARLNQSVQTAQPNPLNQTMTSCAVLIDDYADREVERLGGSAVVQDSGRLTNWVQGIRDGARLLRGEVDMTKKPQGPYSYGDDGMPSF